MLTRQQQAHSAALLVPAALLGGALLSQYGFGLHPCEMCLWQRWPHLAAIGFGLLALAAAGSARPLLIGLAALAIGISGAIGGFHAGVEYGWWEGLTACSTALPTGGDPLEAIMNAPITRCDVAPWGLLGISLAGYNFLLSMGSAALILALLMLASRRSKP